MRSVEKGEGAHLAALNLIDNLLLYTMHIGNKCLVAHGIVASKAMSLA